MCNVIAIANQKGGVGKSITASSLGFGLVRKGKKVLLIDNDAQASLTISLGYQRPDELPVTLTNIMFGVIKEESMPSDIGILHHVEGVDLIPANITLADVELNLVNTLARETILRQFVEAVKPYYDYIIIDTSPSLGMLTTNALAAADSVIIPVQAEYLSAKGLELLLNTIARVKRQINPSLTISGIILTMVNDRTNDTKEIIELINNAYGSKLPIFGKIPRSIRASEITKYGKSIFAYNPTGKVAVAYEALTREVLSIA